MRPSAGLSRRDPRASACAPGGARTPTPRRALLYGQLGSCLCRPTHESTPGGAPPWPMRDTRHARTRRPGRARRRPGADEPTRPLSRRPEGRRSGAGRHDSGRVGARPDHLVHCAVLTATEVANLRSEGPVLSDSTAPRGYARATGLEPATCGFGDRCTTSRAAPVRCSVLHAALGFDRPCAAFHSML